LSPEVVAIVLLAALLHASWNTLAKGSPDRLVTMTLFAVTSLVISLLLAPLAPLPRGQAWLWLLAGALLHSGYKQVLLRAYGAGDLSQVYPLARGAAPLLVTGVSLAFLDEPLRPQELLGMGLLLLGIFALSLKPGGKISWPMLAYALGTACFTAAYTLVDGLGARILGNALSFTIYLHLFDGIIMLGLFALQRGRSSLAVWRLPAAVWRQGFLAAVFSFTAFSLIIWAMTQAPIALVAALRESSILFALLLSILVLKERPTVPRLAAGGLILTGLLVTRLG
tara:strand:+ start:2348 stop:3193 length:846 start_codon:yes stop_codon:yes gene_type:complete